MGQREYGWWLNLTDLDVPPRKKEDEEAEKGEEEDCKCDMVVLLSEGCQCGGK